MKLCNNTVYYASLFTKLKLISLLYITSFLLACLSNRNPKTEGCGYIGFALLELLISIIKEHSTHLLGVLY